MNPMLRLRLLLLTLMTLTGIWTEQAFSQGELEPWGNITGIRIDGQLMRFETSVRVFGKDWTSVKSTAREKQQPHYSRSGNVQIVSTRIDSLYIMEQLQDMQVGVVKLNAQCISHADTLIRGAFLSILLPVGEYSDSSVQLIDPGGPNVNGIATGIPNEFLHSSAAGIRFVSGHRQLEI